MSVVDAPPGLDFAGPAAGEFRARPRPRRLARLTFALCLLDTAVTFILAARKFYQSGTSLLFVGSLFCLSMAAVGYAVRSARIEVDQGGLRWGWYALRFRMARDRIAAIRYYPKYLGIEAKRGSVLYLSRHDWDRFEELPKAFEDCGLPVEHIAGSAPYRARLQGYGLVLDILMVLTMLASGLLVAFGALR